MQNLCLSILTVRVLGQKILSVGCVGQSTESLSDYLLLNYYRFIWAYIYILPIYKSSWSIKVKVKCDRWARSRSRQLNIISNTIVNVFVMFVLRSWYTLD